MLKKCPYCDETHYENSDRIDCMEVVIARQEAEHQALSKAHEDLKSQYNLVHAAIEGLLDVAKGPLAGNEERFLRQISATDELLRRYLKDRQPKG